MARRIAQWRVYTFHFKGGDIQFTRGFAETSLEAAQRLARAWADQKGYSLLD